MRTTFAFVLVVVLLAGCRQPIAAGPIDFGAEGATADATFVASPNASAANTPLAPSATTTTLRTSTPLSAPTLAATATIVLTPNATATIVLTPNATATVALTPNATPTVALTPNATATVAPTPNAPPTLAGTPNGTRTVDATPNLTPTVDGMPGLTPTLDATPHVTPSVGLPANLMPTLATTAIPTLMVAGTPTPTPALGGTTTPTPTPTVGETTTPTPTELPLGTPGPDALVYQGFWSGQSHGQPEASGWHAAPSWATHQGMLVGEGLESGPAFAAPAVANGGSLATSGGSYAVEAQFRPMDAQTHSGFGIYMRDTLLAPSAAPGPAGPSDHARWRAGVADGHAFLLGETEVPGGDTPAALLISKSVSSVPFSAARDWLTLRLEARAEHYTLLIDGHRVLDVHDARYRQGTGIGVWSDHTFVWVRDFRLYKLAD